MRNTIVTVVVAAAILVVGCNKKADMPNSSTTPPVPSHSILAAWQQGAKAAAVSNFITADWSARPLFTEGSVLSLSEKQFRKFSAADQKAKVDEMMPQLLVLRDLAQAVERAGNDAASSGDKIQARKDFESLKQFGIALDNPDYTSLQRQIGQAIQKIADKDLAQVGQ